MRVLLLTGSPPRHPALPQLGDSQIVAGPDWPDAQTIDGEWLSLRTPEGEYNLAALLSKIPAGQRPDVIFLWADAGWRNRPRQVRCFEGKRIMLFPAIDESMAVMADVFSYLGEERFDRVMLAKSRVHVDRFLAETAAEFRTDRRDVRWLPSRHSASAWAS